MQLEDYIQGMPGVYVVKTQPLNFNVILLASSLLFVLGGWKWLWAYFSALSRVWPLHFQSLPILSLFNPRNH